MKKKLTLVLSLALAVAIGIGGTLAYLTSKPTALINTFTVGSLNITAAEPKWDPNNAKIYPGAVINKDPTVTVTAGSEACYVFVKVDVAADIAAVLAENGINYDTTNWTKLTGEGVSENVYYTTVSAADAATGKTLPAVFTSVTINQNAGNAAIEAAQGDTITVTAYAIQRAGFESNVVGAWNTVKS